MKSRHKGGERLAHNQNEGKSYEEIPSELGVFNEFAYFTFEHHEEEQTVVDSERNMKKFITYSCCANCVGYTCILGEKPPVAAVHNAWFMLSNIPIPQSLRVSAQRIVMIR